MGPTVEELRREAQKTAVGRLHWAIQLWNFDRPTYEAWVELVEDAVLFQIRLVAQSKSNFHVLGEDQISRVIDIGLKNLNLDSSAMYINGNTDITIRFDTYCWLGEAKLALDNSKILHGYDQLTSRYASGMTGQTSGGMLLYVTRDNAQVTLDSWRAALAVQVPNCDHRDGRVPLTFCSSDVCQSTGQALQITHFAVPLLHDPQEAKRGLSEAAKAAGRAARKTARAKRAGKT